jgi:hypothetical protein
MNQTVLDATAVLALLNDEPGARTVASLLSQAVINTVNLAEVVGKLAEAGMPKGLLKPCVANWESWLFRLTRISPSVLDFCDLLRVTMASLWAR